MKCMQSFVVWYRTREKWGKKKGKEEECEFGLVKQSNIDIYIYYIHINIIYCPLLTFCSSLFPFLFAPTERQRWQLPPWKQCMCLFCVCVHGPHWLENTMFEREAYLLLEKWYLRGGNIIGSNKEYLIKIFIVLFRIIMNIVSLFFHATLSTYKSCMHACSLAFNYIGFRSVFVIF